MKKLILAIAVVIVAAAPALAERQQSADKRFPPLVERMANVVQSIELSAIVSTEMTGVAAVATVLAQADDIAGSNDSREVYYENCAAARGAGAAPIHVGEPGYRLADERNLAGAMSPELFQSFIFCLPPGEQFLAYAVAGADNDVRPGHRRWNVVWYRPAEEMTALPRLMTDVTGRTHQFSIPPTLVTPAVIAECSMMPRACCRRISPLLCA